MAIRVLHLVHWLNHGGIENWLLDLIRNTDRRQIHMDVCCRGPVKGGHLEDQYGAAGASILHAPLSWDHVRFGWRLGAELRHGKYDVIHVHAGSLAGYPMMIGRRNGVGTAVTFHTTSFPSEGALAWARGWLREIYTRRSFAVACRIGDAIVSCSRATEQAVSDLSGVRPDKRFHVVLNGTSKPPGRDEQRRAQVRHELGIAQDAPLAIHVGRINEPKNHAGLLRVASQIHKILPRFRLLLAGDGPLRAAVEGQITALGLHGVVTLLGSRNDVDRLLEAADLFIFPSLWEGLPVAVVEAQMKGLPIVGSDIAPMREATIEGQTSLLFPVAQEEEMARAVAMLFNNPGKRIAMGQAAMRLAMTNFSMASNADRYAEIYATITR